MSKYKVLLSIAPPRLGGIDFLLPLFFQLKQKNSLLRIELLIIEKKLWLELNDNEFLIQQLKAIDVRLTNMNWVRREVSFFSKTINNIMNYLLLVLVLYRFIKLFAVLATNSPVIMIHSRNVQIGALSFIRWLVKFKKGKIYSHPNTMTIFHGREMVTEKSHINGSDNALYFSSEGNQAISLDYNKKYIIGYPKLYNDWLSHVKELGNEYRKDIVHNAKQKDKKVVALFLFSIVKGVVNIEDYNEWLSTVLSAIERCYKNPIILIKPHPPVERYRKIINEHMLKSSVEEFRILDLHAGVIASASDVVISAHSSVIIDALGMNVPTILHQNFTPHWLIRHPEVSSFLKLKNPHSYNEKTLVSELNNFKDKEREVSNIGKTLKHKDNFEVFLND
jgi:hypothetical protein